MNIIDGLNELDAKLDQISELGIGGVEEAPIDDKSYVRKNAQWEENVTFTGTYGNLGGGTYPYGNLEYTGKFICNVSYTAAEKNLSIPEKKMIIGEGDIYSTNNKPIDKFYVGQTIELYTPADRQLGHVTVSEVNKETRTVKWIIGLVANTDAPYVCCFERIYKE